MELSILILICIVSLSLLCIFLSLIRFKNAILRRVIKIALVICVIVATLSIILEHSRIQTAHESRDTILGYNPTVYITEYGSKYHRADCGYLWNSCYPVPLYDALSQNYAACSRCSPSPYRDSAQFAVMSRGNPIDLADGIISLEYIVPGIIFGIIMALLIRFNAFTKLDNTKHAFLLDLTNHFFILFGLFFLPAVIVTFCAVYSITSAVVLIIVPFQRIFLSKKPKQNGHIIHVRIVHSNPDSKE